MPVYDGVYPLSLSSAVPAGRTGTPHVGVLVRLRRPYFGQLRPVRPTAMIFEPVDQRGDDGTIEITAGRRQHRIDRLIEIDPGPPCPRV